MIPEAHGGAVENTVTGAQATGLVSLATEDPAEDKTFWTDWCECSW